MASSFSCRAVSWSKRGVPISSNWQNKQYIDDVLKAIVYHDWKIFDGQQWPAVPVVEQCHSFKGCSHFYKPKLLLLNHHLQHWPAVEQCHRPLMRGVPPATNWRNKPKSSVADVNIKNIYHLIEKLQMLVWRRCWTRSVFL